MTRAEITHQPTRQVPWHGIGSGVSKTDTTSEMLRKAGLNWEVEMVPVYARDRKDPIRGKFAVRRAIDKHVYDVVGSRWKPVQNHEIVGFFREWAAAGKATIEHVGHMHSGKRIWALARLGADMKLPGDDRVNGYGFLVGSHEAGRATQFLTTTIRVTCSNMLPALLHGRLADRVQSRIRWTHAREFDRELAAKEIGEARERIVAFEKSVRTLTKLNLSREDAIRILTPIVQPQAKPADLIKDEMLMTPTMRNILWANTRAPGAVPGTGWGLMNAVTYAADHMGETDSPDGRFFATTLGHQASRKTQVLTKLLELA